MALEYFASKVDKSKLGLPQLENFKIDPKLKYKAKRDYRVCFQYPTGTLFNKPPAEHMIF